MERPTRSIFRWQNNRSNEFTIYKKCYLALDAGNTEGLHFYHYFPRTIAHNCILIKMPGEVFPKYQAGPVAENGVQPPPTPHDGLKRHLWFIYYLCNNILSFRLNIFTL